MYLSKKHYIGNKWRKKGQLVRVIIPKNQKGVTFPTKHGSINTEKIQYIEEEVMYWRKANAIHRWFVENVQDGNDNCGTYYVSSEQLKELLARCEKIINASELVKGRVANGYTFDEGGKKKTIWEDGKCIKDSSVAKELLPTSEGFFFGSTDYDQWYFDDIQETYNVLSEELKKDDRAEYYYSSSW